MNIRSKIAFFGSASEDMKKLLFVKIFWLKISKKWVFSRKYGEN